MSNTPTVAELQQIVRTQDMVLRNLLITDAYHRLSLSVRTSIGSGANWCTFATWASKQAGRTIRREDLRQFLRRRLKTSAEVSALLRDFDAAHTLAAFIDQIADAIDDDPAFLRAAQSVAEGNLKVFEEIALEFARFLEAETSSDPAAFDRFIAALRPGDAPEGQRLLVDAFRAYHRALAETDGSARGQWLFYANLLVGLHEQTRLQPQIAAALNSALDQEKLRKRIISALLPGFWRRIRYKVAAWFRRRPPLDELLDRLLPQMQRDLRHVVTAEVMTLQFPGGVVVRLGKDVKGTFPPSLQLIANSELNELLQRVDLTADSTKGTGAWDWSVLRERMHLITDLFRCRHEWEPLFEAPFTSAQLVDLYAGRRPAEPL